MCVKARRIPNVGVTNNEELTTCISENAAKRRIECILDALVQFVRMYEHANGPGICPTNWMLFATAHLGAE